MRYAWVVGSLHDRMELSIDFALGPRKLHSILTHLQSARRDMSVLAASPVRGKSDGRRNIGRLQVEDILAPSATQKQHF